MLKAWLTRLLNGETTDELNLSSEESSLSGLNLKEVLDSHEAWKVKLEKELTGSSVEKLDASFIASDSNCTLGKWLHTVGKKKFSGNAEFKVALDAHAKFHHCAAEVVSQHQSGNTEKARQLLKTTFREASNTNQIELVKLFVSAKS